MIPAQRGQELHLRSSRGESLTAAEHAELADWYAELDAGEQAMLRREASAIPTEEELRTQIGLRLGELQSTLEEIRRIEERNEALRRQNKALREQLVEKGILTTG